MLDVTLFLESRSMIHYFILLNVTWVEQLTVLTEEQREDNFESTGRS